jgi:hypothetical protein
VEHLVVNCEAQMARRLWDHADEIQAQAQAARDAGDEAGYVKLLNDARAARHAAHVTVARALSLENGTNPEELDPARLAPLTPAELKERASMAKGAVLRDLRHQRDGLLAASDWTQMPDAPLSEKQRAAWAAYREKLRNLPASKNHDFPDPPA